MARLNLRAPEELFPHLLERHENVSEAIRQSLMRYFALMGAGRQQLQGILEGKEIAILIDITNSVLFNESWMESGAEKFAYEVENVDVADASKWGVDRAQLAEKLRGLNCLQAAALIDAIQRFWIRRGSIVEIAGGMKGWESILE